MNRAKIVGLRIVGKALVKSKAFGCQYFSGIWRVKNFLKVFMIEGVKNKVPWVPLRFIALGYSVATLRKLVLELKDLSD